MIPNYKYKTVLCRYWENSKNKTLLTILDGVCPLGQRCHFAHGKHELRKINDVKVYKIQAFNFNPN